MATDFTTNAIITTGGISPSCTDTPGDIRTRIELLEDMESIPLPYIGMIVYCKETDAYYKITGLSSKIIGLSIVENASVESYEKIEFSTANDKIDLSKYALKSELEAIELTPGPKGDTGATGLQGIQGIQGEPGKDGLTTSILLNNTEYIHNNGVIRLPEYPTVPTNISSFINDSDYVTKLYVDENIASILLLINDLTNQINVLTAIINSMQNNNSNNNNEQGSNLELNENIIYSLDENTGALVISEEYCSFNEETGDLTIIFK